jgi:hypothetical protein
LVHGNKLLQDYFGCSGWSYDLWQAGKDTINGGPGNDLISHSGNLDASTDQHKDVINCGPCHDTVFIDTRYDHNVATNCQLIKD